MRSKDLEKRREQILEFVVSSFIESSNPVSSSTVSARFNKRFSPATVRNDMAELEELGLLSQPHISAGRVPTEKGYRFYVDRLIKEESVPPQLQIDIAREMERGSGNLEGVLSAVSRLLSLITHQAGFILFPNHREDSLRQVQFSLISPHRMIGTWLMGSGEVFSRVIEAQEELDQETVSEITHFFNEEAVGLSLDEVENLFNRELEEHERKRARLRELARTVWEVARIGICGDRLVLEGYRHIIDQPEFQESSKIRSLVEILEDKQDLLRVVKKDLGQEGVHIHIGHEDFSDPMAEFSLVTSGYSLGGHPVGVLGVLGPCRMSYSKAIGSCRYMARLVEGLLGERQ